MLKRKPLRSRGKIPFKRFFQTFNNGDSVSLVRELSSSKPSFPSRMQGRTGKVVGKRGNAYVIEVYDFNMLKQFIVKPVHLRVVEASK